MRKVIALTSAVDKKRAGRILSTLVFVGPLNLNPPSLKATWEAAIRHSEDVEKNPFEFPTGVILDWENLEEVTAKIHHIAGAASIKEVLAAVSNRKPQDNEREFGKLRDDWRLPLWAAFAAELAQLSSNDPYEAVREAARKRQETHGR